jgi:hypothetical protein
MDNKNYNHNDKVKDIISTLEKAGIKSMPLNDLAKLLPDNPEWEKYCTNKRIKK